ncbi:N-acetyltransferase [Flavobacterium sp. CAU 1735]|uniref:N-acetyltransferase n=1 Tax=Flavobacterium sp. CAU 1735 TaxID=3140361 RepID=UPI0032619626
MWGIVAVNTKVFKEISIERVTDQDYKKITKARFFFNWKTERQNCVYKLRILESEVILGLISLTHYPEESRIEINLLAVSKENRGKEKQYDDIAGNLIGFACKEAVNHYAEIACVSLIPKTKLKKHYITKYGMEDAGKHICLEGLALFRIIEKYIDESGEIK